MQIGPRRFLNPQPPGRYVNHSCEPNAKVYKLKQLVALRDIAVGEEITFDYSTTMYEGGRWAMECHCGTPSCRGSIRDFVDLPVDLQLAYLKMSAVSDYILEA